MNLNNLPKPLILLLEHTHVRGLTQVHLLCHRLGKVRTSPPQNLLYYKVRNCKKKDKSILQVEKSKACVFLAFWNEHTEEYKTSWLHCPGKISMFGFLFYMKVASEVPKISSFSQVFLTLLVFKILFPTPPPPLPYFQILLLFWNFCFLLSGTFRNQSQILQIKFPPGCQSHLKKGRRKTKQQQQQLF